MKVTTVWILPMFMTILGCTAFAADPNPDSWRERVLTIETYNLVVRQVLITG
jgi:hypothetical protein